MTRAAVFLSFIIAAAGVARGGSGDVHLMALDAAANAPTDTWFRFSATTQVPGKTAREMAFEVQNMGEKRLVKFLAPSDIKGTRVLVLSRKQMWVYLPAYKKVRRVASHVKQQGFMGTMYSDEDMSTSHYAVVYDAELLAKDDLTLTLSLSPKPGTKSGYARLEMDLRRDIMLPSQIRFFNDSDQLIKTEHRPEYDCGSDVCTPRIMKMVDHTRGDAWTELSAVERRVNQGISDRVFSVRNLERGR